MNYFEIENGSVLFRDNGETVRVSPWGKNSLRVESVFLGDIPEENAALLPCEKTEAEIEILPDRAVITNGKIRSILKAIPWGPALELSFENEKGELLLSEIANGGCLQRRARDFRALAGGNYELRVHFSANSDEKIYGMGQYQQEIMNLKGCNLELSHRNSQASIPFYYSTKGYGFLWNNAAVGEVHFGSNTTEWEARSTKKMDYWITAGDNAKEIERAFACAVGKVPMMPEYGLGFWQCKLRYYNQEQVLQVAREYHKRKIPVDVIVIDYYHWPHCGDWRFDEEFFPDPEAMVKELHEYGIETMVSVWPQVEEGSENYKEMRQKGLLVRQKGGLNVQHEFHGNNSFMDATNPRTRAYVWDKIRKNYQDLGIRTYWLDEAEPEFETYDYDLYRYAAGDVTEIGNIYPREYARLFYEGQQSYGQNDIVNLLRCAWVGSQRYGALVWSGDINSSYEAFRKQICVGIHMGLSGIPWWTTDIGGFYNGNIEDEKFKKLLMRWFQWGTFCPVMRIHGTRDPHKQVIDKNGNVREWEGAPNEVWSYGPECEAIMTKYIGIRELMRDYNRTLMAEAHENGDPVIRALFYEFGGDEKTYDITDEYMFGPDVLVAPVCHEDAYEREVYLPSGAVWTDAHTGEKFEGGQKVLAEAPLDVIPVFLRDGKLSELIGKI